MSGPQLRIFNWPGVTQMAKHKKHLKVTSNRCLILCRSDQKAWPQLRSFTRTLTHVLSKWLRLHETSREETFQETQMEALRLFWPSFKRHESYFHHVLLSIVIFSSVQFSHWVMSNSLRPHGLQHTRPPCLSPTPRVYSNSCALSQWCHTTISFSVVPFSSHLQSFPASQSFQMSQLFALGGQSTGVSSSASVLPMNIQDWFPLGWTGWISLQS